MRAEPAEVDVERVPGERDDFPTEAHDSPDRGTPELQGLPARVEAVLFSASTPVPARRLAEGLGASEAAIGEAVDALEAGYRETGRSFAVERLGGGYRLATRPAWDDAVRAVLSPPRVKRPGRAIRETLAIVAYRQPVLRTDIEAIRGVACGDALRTLMDEGLVRVAGRADLPGRPMLYGTTGRLLDALGIASLKDLPDADDVA